MNPLQLDILPLVQLVATDTVDLSFLLRTLSLGIPQWLSGGSDGKESACNLADLGSIPGSGRSPGEGNGYPASILAWRIPWTEKPAGLQSMGSQS